MQAWTPERPRRNWVLSEGSESVDMRDVSAQLVYDSPSTNFADSPSYYGRPAMMPGQFADEATAEAYMAHAESDFWARAAAAQRAESSLRFTHTVHSDVLHYDDSFLSLDDSLDRSPSPVLRAASPRRFLGTPARAWGATPETLVDSEGWTPGHYSDELQGSDGYAYGSDYGSQYGYMSSPIVRNPPGSVAPPGILGHIRDNDTSGEVSIICLFQLGSLTDHCSSVYRLQTITFAQLPFGPSCRLSLAPSDLHPRRQRQRTKLITFMDTARPRPLPLLGPTSALPLPSPPLLRPLRTTSSPTFLPAQIKIRLPASQISCKTT